MFFFRKLERLEKVSFQSYSSYFKFVGISPQNASPCKKLPSLRRLMKYSLLAGKFTPIYGYNTSVACGQLARGLFAWSHPGLRVPGCIQYLGPIWTISKT